MLNMSLRDFSDYKYIGMAALLLGAYSTIALLWNIAGLVYFRYKYGISD